jgi:hypothetical protein
VTGRGRSSRRASYRSCIWRCSARANISGQQLGREPTAQDVATRLDRPVEDILDALAAGDAYHPASLDAPIRHGELEAATGQDLLIDRRRDIKTVRTASRSSNWRPISAQPALEGGWPAMSPVGPTGNAAAVESSAVRGRRPG